MKQMMADLQFKPRGLKQNCESETKYHKARIIGFSALMGSIALTYQTYLQNVVYRSQQFQDQVMAGQKSLQQGAWDRYGLYVWEMKNTLSVLESKSWKELKYISQDWKDHSYTGSGGSTRYGNPQEENPSTDYFNQQVSYEPFWNDEYSRWQKREADERYTITWAAEKYEEWEKLSQTIWFDTQGCMSGSMVGEVNMGTIQPAGDGDMGSQWERGYETSTTNNEGVTTSKAWQAFNPDNYSTANPYSTGTDLSVPEGMLTFNDEDLYRDALKEQIDLIEDCDIDCQAKGSQLTLVAGLNQLAYVFIAINAILMFIGTWMYRARVASVYCSIFSCMFQFAIIVTSGVILSSPYNMVCRRSMIPTAGQLQWTMRDDFGLVATMWIMSIITLLPFLCCGLCSAVKSEH